MLLWGLVAAITCAICTQLAGLCKHRGANNVPDISFAHPLKATKMLFSSGWFTIGMILAVIAFGFHATAMALAPISWVQAILAAGVVSLAVIADRTFGHAVSRRQWFGIGLVAAGLTMFALTVPHPPEHGQVAMVGVLVLEVTLMAIGVALLKAHSHGIAQQHGGMIFGMVAGIFMALGNIAIKAFFTTGSVMFLGISIICAIGGFFTAARGFQLEAAVPVLTAMSLAANIVCIVGGWVVFSEPIPQSTLPIIVHFSGFGLLILAAWLIPGAQYETNSKSSAAIA